MVRLREGRGSGRQAQDPVGGDAGGVPPESDGYCTGPRWARQASPAAARSSQNPG